MVRGDIAACRNAHPRNTSMACEELVAASSDVTPLAGAAREARAAAKPPNAPDKPNMPIPLVAGAVSIASMETAEPVKSPLEAAMGGETIATSASACQRPVLRTEARALPRAARGMRFASRDALRDGSVVHAAVAAVVAPETDGCMSMTPSGKGSPRCKASRARCSLW